jgi:hypothetical protein
LLQVAHATFAVSLNRSLVRRRSIGCSVPTVMSCRIGSGSPVASDERAHRGTTCSRVVARASQKRHVRAMN